MLPLPCQLLSVPPSTVTSSRTKLVLASLRVKLIKAVSVLVNWVRLLVMAMVGMVVNEINVGSLSKNKGLAMAPVRALALRIQPEHAEPSAPQTDTPVSNTFKCNSNTNTSLAV